MKKGKEYELLIEEIYRKLDPTSIIKRNDKIFGQDTSQNREIDISIRSKIGIHSILIIVQAKDYKKPVDVNTIGEFITVIKDVRANKGILISAKGFTKGAARLAKTYDVEILTAIDTKNPNWSLNVRTPVIINSISGNFNYNFNFVITDEYIEKVIRQNRVIPLPSEFEYVFTTDKGKTLIKPIEEFRKMYLADELLIDNAEHLISFQKENLEIVVEENLYVPAHDLYITYSFYKTSRLKYFDINEFKGFINRLTQEINPSDFKLTTNDFTIDNYDLTEIKPFSYDDWIIIEDTSKLQESFKINLYHLPQLKQKSPAQLTKL